MIAVNSIYGDNLLAFPEAMQTFNYFFMTPQISDNYIPLVASGYNGIDANFQAPLSGIYTQVSGFAPQGTYRGVFHNDESSVKDAMGNLINYQKYVLWAREVFDPGWFISWQNTVYRIVASNDWPTMGGFTEYEIERLVGSDGQGTVPSNLGDGSSNYQ